jgi:hypothetical protein
VYQRSGAQYIASTQVDSTDEKHVILSVPALRPGWYSASLAMSSRGVLVGEQSLDLIQLADEGPLAGLPGQVVPTDPFDPHPRTLAKTYFPDRRFGVIATDLPFDGWHELPDVLPFLSVGRVKLAVWSQHGDVQGYDAAKFDHLLERLGELGITPTACLVDLPPRIAEEIDAVRQSQSLIHGLVSKPDVVEDEASRWVRLLDAPVDTWRPQLAHLISRHAQHLDRWQLGADGTDAFVTRPKMRDVYGLVYREFAGLMNRPDLAMPWPGWYEMDGQLPATVALSVPSSVLPSQLPLYIQDLSASATSSSQAFAKEAQSFPTLSINLELLDAQQYGRETQIRDFAQRVVYALAGGATRIDLPLPFNVKKVGVDVVKQPQELLLVMRTLITTLGHAEFKGKVPIAENVEAFLFDRSGQGILVLWSRGNDPAPKKLPLNLGTAPVRVDLWGNVTPLVRGVSVEALNTNLGLPASDVSLDIGPMPTFLIDIDGPAAQLRAGVGFHRPLIESSFQPHRRTFHFTNPYKQAISGTFRLRPPAGWTLTPSVQTFNLNPGETFEREIILELPYNSIAGVKTIDAQFDVQAERPTQFSVPVTLNLGLSDVGLQTLALRDKGDIVVQQMITNYGDVPINYTAFAILPGAARQERLVTQLGAGRSTIKLYRFPAARIPEGTKVRSGVKEMVGTRILNDEVPVQ